MHKLNVVIVAVSIIVAMIVAAAALVSVPLAVAIALFILVGTLMLIVPISGIVLYLILIIIRPQDFVPALGNLRVMLVLATVVILSLLLRHAVGREALPSLRTRQQILMFVFLLIIPISDLSNLHVGAAWQSFDDFLTLYLFFLIIVLQAGNRYGILYWTIALATVALAANGIIQHYRGFDLAGQVPEAGRVRWVGIFGDPNDFALLLVSVMPLILFKSFEKHLHFLLRIVLVTAFGILVAALYFTQSRGGQIALMMILGAFALKRWGILKGIIIGVPLLAAAVLLAPSRMMEISPYGQSESGRVYAWIDGLTVLKSHPVFGLGYNKFTEYHGMGAHSAFIMCMADLGLVGYFVWLALIYTSFRAFSTAERLMPGRDEARYSQIAQVSMLGFLGSAYFLSQTYSPVIYFLFAIAGLVSSATARTTGIRIPFLTMKETGIVLAFEVASILSYKVLAMFY